MTIPNSVTNIGSSAFSSCVNLSRVNFEGNHPLKVGEQILGWWTEDGGYDYGPAIVYYLPGTSGWDSTFGGCPTAVWLPEIRTSDATFGGPSDQFGFTISWASDTVVVVEAADNLAKPAWSAVSTNTLAGGTSCFIDVEWAKHPSRFYRVRAR